MTCQPGSRMSGSGGSCSQAPFTSAKGGDFQMPKTHNVPLCATAFIPSPQFPWPQLIRLVSPSGRGGSLLHSAVRGAKEKTEFKAGLSTSQESTQLGCIHSEYPPKTKSRPSTATLTPSTRGTGIGGQTLHVFDFRSRACSISEAGNGHGPSA